MLLRLLLSVDGLCLDSILKLKILPINIALAVQSNPYALLNLCLSLVQSLLLNKYDIYLGKILISVSPFPR